MVLAGPTAKDFCHPTQPRSARAAREIRRQLRASPPEPCEPWARNTGRIGHLAKYIHLLSLIIIYDHL